MKIKEKGGLLKFIFLDYLWINFEILFVIEFGLIDVL